MKQFMSAVLILAASVVPASAQAPPAGFVRGFGGVSFLSETGGVFGVSAGVHASRSIDVFGDIGRISPSEMRATARGDGLGRLVPEQARFLRHEL